MTGRLELKNAPFLFKPTSEFRPPETRQCTHSQSARSRGSSPGLARWCHLVCPFLPVLFGSDRRPLTNLWNRLLAERTRYSEARQQRLFLAFAQETSGPPAQNRAKELPTAG